METERLWERLLESLNAWAATRQTGPGEIEVATPAGGTPARLAVIVMTPAEWNDMASVVFGDVEAALASVKRTLLGLAPEERYAVYRDYELIGSSTPTLPESRAPEPIPGAKWGILARDGRFVSLDDLEESD